MLRPSHPIRLAFVAGSLLAIPACSDTPTTFGEVQAHTSRERNVDWKADDKTRLLLREMGPASQGQAPQAAAPTFQAKVPDGWETLPPRQFRDASWRVTGTDAECALLASVRGGLRGNVDRWSDQFGATHLTAEQLGAAPTMELLGKPAKLIEIEGTFGGKPDQMLLGLITDTDPQATLKFTGSKAVVQQNRDKFLALAKSIAEGKAAAQPQPAAGGQGGSDVPTGYTGDLPAGWTQLPSEPQRFRDAVFGVPGGDGDVSFTASVGGGMRGNIDRWTGQFGLPALTEEQLAQAPQHPLAGKTAKLVELQGAFRGREGQAMLALITDGNQGSTFKFTGPAAVVMAEKANFLALAASLRKGQGKVSAPGAAPAQTPQMPAGHGATPPPAAPTSSAFAATIPAGWVKKPSNKEMHHTFGKSGEVYISALGGDLRQILDVWRSEMKMEPFTDAEFTALPKLPLLGQEGVLMDIAGDYEGMVGNKIPGARMLVGACKDGNAIVFVKLFGAADDVTAQKDAFAAFCSSLRRNP
jgi:hypothetical protein